jgi:hypothetical protein
VACGVARVVTDAGYAALLPAAASGRACAVQKFSERSRNDNVITLYHDRIATPSNTFES